MRVLFINGMCPSPRDLVSGIFITRRLKELSIRSVAFTCICPVRDFSGGMRLAGRFLGKEFIAYPTSLIFDGVSFEYVTTKVDAYDFIGYKFFGTSTLIERMGEDILKAIPTEKYDLVHAHWTYPHGAVANYIAKRLGVCSIITAHGSDIHTIPVNNSFQLGSTLQTLEEANQVIFVSSALREKAKELGFKNKNSVVIPNGIDTDLFKPMDKEKIKNHFNIPGPCIGFVGNLIPIKRADCLPIIFQEISRIRSDATFLVVGDGFLRKQIEKGSKKLGLDVRFTGKIPQESVPLFMNAMDIMLLPSLNEGWPCVVLEAQACGVFVVGSGNGGIPEAVGDGGEIVSEGNRFEKRFASAAVRLIESSLDISQIVNRAGQFTWSNIVKQEMGIYQVVSGIKHIPTSGSLRRAT